MDFSKFITWNADEVRVKYGKLRATDAQELENAANKNDAIAQYILGTNLSIKEEA